MAETAVKVKIMPENIETSLNEIAEEAREKIKKAGGNLVNTEQEPIAFGLKALILTISWPEEKDTDIIENALSEIKGVSSCQIIDYRRAFG